MEKVKFVSIISLGAVVLLLASALVVTIVKFNNFKNEAKPAVVQPQEPEVKVEQPETIDMQEFKDYASQYGLSIEFLQNFFTDEIVYKNSDGIIYSPIDENLEKNDYDFDNIVREETEFKYVEDGDEITIKGIDISKYQGNINWQKVANDGVEYAFIRVGNRGYGNGELVEDPLYRQNIEGALNAGVDVGVYFYSQSITVEEAIEEAEFVLELIQGYDITYPVVYDAEEVFGDDVRTNVGLTAELRTDMTIAFCDAVKDAGYEPMVYGNIKWFVEMLDMTRLTQYDKWFAQYFKTPFFPYDFQIWQYTSAGTVDGVSGDCDLNISFKDYNPPEENSSSDISQ